MTTASAAYEATLLFVDDEPSVLSSLQRLFRSRGYSIFTANGAAQGIDILEKESIDLVMSDMRMPGADGSAFLEQVRLRWPDVVRLLLTGCADIASTISAINRGEIYRYVSKPWSDDEIVLTVRDALDRRRLAAENRRLLALVTSQNAELTSLNASLETKVADRTAQLEQAMNDLKRGFVASVGVFSNLIELRGSNLVGHGRRVAAHAKVIARRLGVAEDEAQDILLGGLLHDIGKIVLPNDLIERPFHGLAAEARNEVMQHAAKGQAVLMGVDELKGASILIRHHHECYDGSGFPDRLTGSDIPLGARIIAVANDFDAVQLGTLLNRRMNPKEAVAFLTENRMRRYDPHVVDAFVACQSERNGSERGALMMRPWQLQPGMSLDKDLLHKDGTLLLAGGYVLSAEMIDQLQKMETASNNAVTLSIRQEWK